MHIVSFTILCNSSIYCLSSGLLGPMFVGDTRRGFSFSAGAPQALCLLHLSSYKKACGCCIGFIYTAVDHFEKIWYSMIANIIIFIEFLIYTYTFVTLSPLRKNEVQQIIYITEVQEQFFKFFFTCLTKHPKCVCIQHVWYICPHIMYLKNMSIPYRL